MEDYVIPINRHPNEKGDALVVAPIWPHLRGPLLESTNPQKEYYWFGSPLSLANRRTRRRREPFRDRSRQNFAVTRPALSGLNREGPASFELRFFSLEGEKRSTRPSRRARFIKTTSTTLASWYPVE